MMLTQSPGAVPPPGRCGFVARQAVAAASSLRAHRPGRPPTTPLPGADGARWLVPGGEATPGSPCPSPTTRWRRAIPPAVDVERVCRAGEGWPSIPKPSGSQGPRLGECGCWRARGKGGGEGMAPWDGPGAGKCWLTMSRCIGSRWLPQWAGPEPGPGQPNGQVAGARDGPAIGSSRPVRWFTGPSRCDVTVQAGEASRARRRRSICATHASPFTCVCPWRPCSCSSVGPESMQAPSRAGGPTHARRSLVHPAIEKGTTALPFPSPSTRAALCIPASV